MEAIAFELYTNRVKSVHHLLDANHYTRDSTLAWRFIKHVRRGGQMTRSGNDVLYLSKYETYCCFLNEFC
jgi:hypothetical protein